MNEERKIEIIFSSNENQLYELILKRCEEKKLTISDYIKNLIKMDLAWGKLFEKNR